MSTYYNQRGLTPAATPADIESAIDTKYNEYRRLVTNRDGQVAAAAGESLRQLERIRTTLLDPARREIYDEGAGIRTVAPLLDPTAIPPVPHLPVAPSPAPATLVPPTLWECPSCHTRNPEHINNCLNCGTDLLMDCPHCHQKAVLVITRFCGNCGYHYDVALRRNTLLAQQKTISTSINQIRYQISQLQESQKVNVLLYSRVPFSERMKMLVPIMLSVIGVAVCGMTALSWGNSPDFTLAMCMFGSMFAAYFGSLWFQLKRYKENIQTQIEALYPRLKEYDDQFKRVEQEMKRVDANKGALV